MPRVRPAPWEFERHRRGSIRWYPFDALLLNGLASAGSTSALGPPLFSMNTGGATATPQNRGREMVERKGGAGSTAEAWTGTDNVNYWGRVHRMTSWMGIGASFVTPANGSIYAGIFLMAPGAPPHDGPRFVPMAMLRYARTSPINPSIDERFELITAIGDGSNATVTRLTNVPGPFSDVTPGGQKTQRLELIHVPGQYVAALIDGKLGAKVTATLPNPAQVPIANQNMAGWGVYLENAQIGDAAVAGFHSGMIETFRP